VGRRLPLKPSARYTAPDSLSAPYRNVLESWRETFDMEMTDDGAWTWKSFWEDTVGSSTKRSMCPEVAQKRRSRNVRCHAAVGSSADVNAEGFMRARVMSHRSGERVLHALHCWVLAVLHLDPVLRSARAKGRSRRLVIVGWRAIVIALARPADYPSSRLMSTTKPSGISGMASSSCRLQTGQGAPAPPQPQARGTSPRWAQRSRSSSATSSETSRDHPSSVLNATTRTGLLH
jgi:hypothetical protein